MDVSSASRRRRALRILRSRGLEGLLIKVARRYHLAVDQLFDGLKSPLRVQARRIVFAHLRVAGFSFPEIGEVFGRDHSTVMHDLIAGVVRADGRLTIAQNWLSRVKRSEADWSADEAAAVLVGGDQIVGSKEIRGSRFVLCPGGDVGAIGVHRSGAETELVVYEGNGIQEEPLTTAQLDDDARRQLIEALGGEPE